MQYSTELVEKTVTVRCSSAFSQNKHSFLLPRCWHCPSHRNSFFHVTRKATLTDAWQGDILRAINRARIAVATSTSSIATCSDELIQCWLSGLYGVHVRKTCADFALLYRRLLHRFRRVENFQRPSPSYTIPTRTRGSALDPLYRILRSSVQRRYYQNQPAQVSLPC